jgi:hypothetical protein
VCANENIIIVKFSLKVINYVLFRPSKRVRLIGFGFGPCTFMLEMCCLNRVVNPMIITWPFEGLVNSI